ncbi:MAG: tRNA (guanosine(46)-N7)-methyltransferase TrmB [Steroidobacter sp.]
MSDDRPIDQPSVARRTVRSYVVRAGRTTAAQERALVELWPQYGVEFSSAPLDLDQLFGRTAPRMIEIGFGAGEALLAFAQAHPDIDCIGVEVHQAGVGHLLLDAHAAGVANLRIISHDVVEVLRQQLAPASISTAHIFFPDPWPKKRHHKRRLIQPAFVELLARAMTEAGTLRLATDWEPYASQMREVLDASIAFANVAGEEGFVARSTERPLTRFERRGQRMGHGVWDLCYRRLGAVSGLR